MYRVFEIGPDDKVKQVGEPIDRQGDAETVAFLFAQILRLCDVPADLVTVRNYHGFTVFAIKPEDT